MDSQIPADSSLPPGAIPEDQFQAHDQGAVPEGAIPEEHFQSHEDKYGSAGEQAKAGLEGVAQGALGPIASFAERSFGAKPEDIRGRAEENPITHGVGEATGLVGSSLLGTGEGALLDKAGEAVTHGLGLTKAATEASTAAKIAAAGVKSAIETGLFQGSDELSNMILNDPNTTAESAAANVGLAGLGGGILGAGIGSLSPLWKAAVGDRVAPILADMKSRLNFRSVNPDIESAALEELQNKFNNYSDLKDKLFSGEESGGGLIGDAIAKALPEDTQPIIKQGQELATKFDDVLGKMRENEYKYPKRLVNNLEADIQNWQKTAFEGNASAEQVFNANQDLKRTLQDYAKFEKVTPRTAEEYSFIKDMKDLSHELRTSMEDSSVWGKAADVQKNINKAITDFIPAEKDFTGKFTSKVLGDKQIDPAKLQTYLKQAGGAKGALREQALENFLDRHDALIGAVNKAFTDQGLEPQVQHTATSVLRDTLGKKTVGTKLMDGIIDKYLDNAIGHTAGSTIGAGIGSRVAGEHGAEAGAWLGALAGDRIIGKHASSIMQGVAKKLLLNNDISAGGAKSAIDYAVAAAKGDNALGKAAKGVFQPGVAASVTSIADRMRLDKLVDKVAQTPQAMVAQNNNGKLGHYMPEHQTAVAETSTRAMQYLQQLKPHPQRLAPLDKEIPPSEAQMQRYYRALDIAQQPSMIFNHIKEGTVLPSDVQDMNAMYPSLYKSMVNKLSTEMQIQVDKGEHIPYHTRIGMSLFMGQPMDSTMTPVSIIQAQPQQKPAPQQGAVPPKKGATSKLGKVNKTYQTPLQGAEADRSNGRGD